MNFDQYVKGGSLIINTKGTVVDIERLVSFLQNNTNIKKLSLVDLDIGDEGVIALANGNLLNLTSLYLGGNNIGDQGAEALTKLSNLTKLNLRNNNIGDEGVRALAKLSKLTELDLARNKIGDQGAEALAKLSKLTFLNLSNNKIHGSGAEALANGNFPKLASLYLQGNNIDNQGAKALANGNLLNLTSLYLYDNDDIDELGKEALANGNLSSLISPFIIKNKKPVTMPCRDTLERKSFSELGTASSNQGEKQQGVQVSGARSNKSLMRKFLPCCRPSSLSSPGGINDDQQGPSSELGEVLPIHSQPNSLKSNDIEMDSRL
ncbi:MAG: leucine-rich repeat domain-containing protein [Wolbachia sp.]